MKRSELAIKPIKVNGWSIRKVIIDEHVRSHADITDDIILDLVHQLDGSELLSDDVNGRFQYFVSLLFLGSKQYRLVWLLEEGEFYIGIITAYRDERKK